MTILILCVQLGIHNQTKQWQAEVEEKLEQREYLDSLYYDHLKDCSMINREEIKLDSRGYLYSQYHRSNGRNF